MPPAFNLSQDQTLRFKAKTLRARRTLADRPSKIEVRLCALAGDVCIRKRRRERPHKLPDSVVKERPGVSPGGPASIAATHRPSMTQSVLPGRWLASQQESGPL